MYIILTNLAGKVLKGLNYMNIIFPFNFDLCDENPFKERNS
jgi:hypothetical protein